MPAIIGIVSGILGAMGLGGGGILIIFLTLTTNISQNTAQGINLIFFIPCALVATFFHIKNKLLQPHILIIVIPFCILGAFLGSFLSSVVHPDILRKIFSILLFLIGIYQIFSKPEVDDSQ